MQQVLHVHVTDSQREGLRDAAAGVQQQEREQMQPPLIKMSRLRLPVHKPCDLGRCERGQDKSVALSVAGCAGADNRTALPFPPSAAPMKVRIDGADC